MTDIILKLNISLLVQCEISFMLLRFETHLSWTIYTRFFKAYFNRAA